MSTDLSAVVTGFASRDAAISAANEAMYRLTGFRINTTQPSLEALMAVPQSSNTICALRPGLSEVLPNVVIHSFARWMPEELSRYSNFVAEIKNLFVGKEILLLSNRTVEAFEDRNFTKAEVKAHSQIFQVS